MRIGIICSPGVLSLSRGKDGAAVGRYDHGDSKPTWTRTIDSPGLVAVSKVAWLANGDALLLLETATSSELIDLKVADGSDTVVATLGARPSVAVSEPTKTFVALVPRTRLYLLPSRRGAKARHRRDNPFVRLPGPGATAKAGAVLSDALGNTNLGFDGRLVWVYSYVASHRSDTMGTKSDERCGYEVYDTANGGARVRQLESGSDGWELFESGVSRASVDPDGRWWCAGNRGGGSARRAAVVKFDGPP